MNSEEEEELVLPPSHLNGMYIVSFDPLDGSSNIDAGVNVLESIVSPTNMQTLHKAFLGWYNLWHSSSFVPSGICCEPWRRLATRPRARRIRVLHVWRLLYSHARCQWRGQRLYS